MTERRTFTLCHLQQIWSLCLTFFSFAILLRNAISNKLKTWTTIEIWRHNLTSSIVISTVHFQEFPMHRGGLALFLKGGFLAIKGPVGRGWVFNGCSHLANFILKSERVDTLSMYILYSYTNSSTYITPNFCKLSCAYIITGLGMHCVLEWDVLHTSLDTFLSSIYEALFGISEI